MKAIDALNEANKIAFSPFVFQTVYTMLELGILEAIHNAKNGISIKEIENKTNVSEYGIRVLCEMAESAQIIEQKTENKYSTTKIGFFIVNDKMTLINLYFTQDVCYNGLYYLKESILNSKPEGLKVFGNWKTIYALSLQLWRLQQFELSCAFSSLSCLWSLLDDPEQSSELVVRK